MVGARVFKLPHQVTLNVFAKPTKPCQGRNERETERGSEWRSSAPHSSLLLVLFYSDFQFPGKQPKRQSSAKRQPEQAAAGNLETSTRTCGTHSHTRTLTYKHQLKFPPYSARSCRSFLRFSAKNLNAYVICAAQSIFTHTHTQRTFRWKNMCRK